MNIFKTLTGLAATAGLMMTVASAQAQVLTPIAITGGNSTAANVAFTSGAAGSLQVSDTNSFFNSKIGLGGATPVTVAFSAITPGTYSFNAGTGSFDQAFGSGSFKVTDNGTGNILLQGTFLGSDLTGFNGGTSGGLNLVGSTVTYGPGTKMGTFSPLNGSLALEFSSVKTAGTDGFVASAAGLTSFTGVDGITYAARTPNTVVPEPGSVAAFAFTGLGMMGLMLRARKSRGNMAA